MEEQVLRQYGLTIDAWISFHTSGVTVYDEKPFRNYGLQFIAPHADEDPVSPSILWKFFARFQ